MFKNINSNNNNNNTAFSFKIPLEYMPTTSKNPCVYLLKQVASCSLNMPIVVTFLKTLYRVST